MEDIIDIEDIENYIKMNDLKNNHSYQIYARNACVGIWVETRKAFLIARYKMGPNPFLFFETHWDYDNGLGYGTVKPVKQIELCPFEITENPDTGTNKAQEILEYLYKLEIDNPLSGRDSVQKRRASAIRWEQRFIAQRKQK
jgi:hypothetical protein